MARVRVTQAGECVGSELTGGDETATQLVTRMTRFDLRLGSVTESRPFFDGSFPIAALLVTLCRSLLGVQRPIPA